MYSFSSIIILVNYPYRYIQNYDIGPIKCYLNLPTLGKTDFSLVSLPFACCTEVGRSIEVVSVENKKNQTIIFIHKFYQLFNFVLNSILDQTIGVSKKLPPNTLKLGVSSTYLVADCLKMRFHIFFFCPDFRFWAKLCRNIKRAHELLFHDFTYGFSMTKPLYCR